MVVMTAALGWLGWRLLEQDRDLSRQRIQERLESAADLASAMLARKLTETETSLTEPPADTTREGVLRIDFTPSAVESHPAARLVYYPIAPSPSIVDESAFGPGDAAEFREHDAQKAAGFFRSLTHSSDLSVRAVALLRLARNLRKTGSTAEALAVYEELAKGSAVSVEGLPAADLAGRYARLDLLHEMDRPSACAEEASGLYNDLQHGRWRLTHSQWHFYIDATRTCFRPDAKAEAREKDLSALAGGVEWLWQEWQRIRNGEAPSGGRNGLWIEDRPILLTWRSTPDHFTAIVGGALLVQQWQDALRPIAERHSARFSVKDADGHLILGSSSTSPSPPRVTRSFGDPRFPWALESASEDLGPEMARLSTRRALLFAGLAVAGLFLLTGGYFITRALTRELQVASLQSDFVAAVSHEFRTPLASLRQMGELLADGRIPNQQRRQSYYEAIRSESERLHRLVENLLDFGRMEAGAQQYQFQSVAPAALVESVADQFAENVRDKGYRLETAAPDSLPRVRADREALGLALWNLLDNAVKYSPLSKTIWIETASEKDHVAIRVRDQGVGIPVREQKEIFKKFVRASGAKMAGIKGTGLGLAMVQHIVSAHGGRIHLSSEPGAGSTFTILLPATWGDRPEVMRPRSGVPNEPDGGPDVNEEERS
jgi:signal transduction histidine kinase